MNSLTLKKVSNSFLVIHLRSPILRVEIIFIFCNGYKMDYENMRVVDLRAFAKERGLRGYSGLNKAELIAFLREPRTSPTPIPPRTRPPPPPPSVRFRPDRPRQLSSQEMDIFEQWEMRKNRPVVMSTLNDWYDWLVNHVPKTIKDNASGAFKTFKDKIMGLLIG